MSHWYDYVPGFSNIEGARKGDWGQAIGGPLYAAGKAGKQYFFDDPANGIKDAYDKAAGQSQQNMKQLMDFYMGQQSKTQGFYKPIESMFKQAYGSGGIQAPQTPTGPGISLKSMYGGT